MVLENVEIQIQDSGTWRTVHVTQNQSQQLLLNMKAIQSRYPDRLTDRHGIGATLNLSAGDLVGHLNCRYLTELDLNGICKISMDVIYSVSFPCGDP